MLPQQKNVIIGGSTKCGTTSLFHYLSNHPQICGSLIKETRFFWNGEYNLPMQKINKKEASSYKDFFFNCSDNQWMLEATPDYLYSQGTADMIRKELPDCRFIFILRDPAERIVSWFKYSRQLGLLPTEILLDEYVKLLMKPTTSETPQYLRAFEQGRYGHYLQYYIDLYGKENVLVVFHKDLQQTPAFVTREVCDYLKIDRNYFDKFDFKIFNPSLNVKDPSQLKKYTKFKKKLRSYNNKLPQSLRNFFRRILKPLDGFYLKTKTDKWGEIDLSSSQKKILYEYYKEDSILLEKLLGKKIVW